MNRMSHTRNRRPGAGPKPTGKDCRLRSGYNMKNSHERDQDPETFDTAKNREIAAKLLMWMKADSKWTGGTAKNKCSRWIKKWKEGNAKSAAELKAASVLQGSAARKTSYCCKRHAT